MEHENGSPPISASELVVPASVERLTVETDGTRTVWDIQTTVNTDGQSAAAKKTNKLLYPTNKLGTVF